MKTLGTKALALLFAALAIGCAFHNPMVEASVSQQDSVFCGTLSFSIVESASPSQPALRVPSNPVMNPATEVYPLWLLARSIDHPPEQPA